MQSFVLLLYNRLLTHQLLVVFFFLYLRILHSNKEFDLQKQSLKPVTKNLYNNLLYKLNLKSDLINYIVYNALFNIT